MARRVKVRMEDPVADGVASPGGIAAREAAHAQAAKVWLGEAAAWAVRRSLESGYHRATGRALPTARERDVPFRRVMVWAAVSAAAVWVANVLVDRVVLRPPARPNAGVDPRW